MMTKQTTDLHHALIGGQARIVSANLTQTIEALDFLKRRFERDRQMMTDLSQAPDSAAAVSASSAAWPTWAIWNRLHWRCCPTPRSPAGCRCGSMRDCATQNHSKKHSSTVADER